MFAPRESFAEGWPIPAGHFPVYVLPSVEVEALRVASPLAPEDLHFPMRVSWVPWLIAQHSSQLNPGPLPFRSEEHTSELQSLMRISYAVFCLKKKKIKQINTTK